MIKAVVVGIDKVNNNKLYRVICCEYKDTEKGKGFHKWDFRCEMLSEESVKASIKKYGNDFFLNLGLDEKGNITGKSSSLSRFDYSKTGHHPVVIIAQYQTVDGRILGYSTATYDGKVRNVVLKEMIAYGNRCNKSNLIPVQNAIFVPADANESKKAHYKSYPNMPFIITLHDVGKNKYVENRKVNIKQNEKSLKTIDDIFTKEQIMQLRLGKDHGVEYRVYANPNLSAKQMEVLRGGLEKGINVRPFSHPDYKYLSMMYYIDCLENNIDIKPFLSSKYSHDQLFQLALASEMGVNIEKLCNPNLNANEMAEILERLEAKIWKNHLVKKDGSWK